MRILLAFLLGLSGLTALGQSVLSTNSVLPPPLLPSVTSTGLFSMVNLGGYVPDDKYKLRPGDRMSLQILEDRDAPKSLVVADSGELDVPYVGRTLAADKTCKQLVEEVKKLLEKEYYHRATVVIALDMANKILGRVYVLGQVHQQGAIEMQVNDNLTAGKAILRAGGLGDFANKKKVKVVRSPKIVVGTNQLSISTNQIFVLNMAEILEEGKIEKDIPLEPEDFVIVPTRIINF